MMLTFKDRLALAMLGGQTRERLAILEAEVRGHIDGCAEKWEETKGSITDLSRKLDERFDQVASQRDHQHHSNVKLLMTIILGVFGYIGVQFFERIFH